MRLIDADKLLKHLNDCALSASPGGGSLKDQMIAKVEYDAIQNCMKAVEEQPIAYDVDAVIEELEKRRKDALEIYAAFKMGTDMGKMYGLEYAINTIKRAVNKPVDPLVGVSVEQLKNELNNQ